MPKSIPAPTMRQFVEMAAGRKLAPWQVDALARQQRGRLKLVEGGKPAAEAPAP